MFELGITTATPRALLLLKNCGISPNAILLRHKSCDWGDVCPEDAAENELALKKGYRLFSVYKMPANAGTIWCITEAGRHATTLLLPDEY